MEEMNSKFDTVLEYTSEIPNINKTLATHTKQLEDIRDEIDAIKSGLSGKANVERVEKIERVLNISG